MQLRAVLSVAKFNVSQNARLLRELIVLPKLDLLT